VQLDEAPHEREPEAEPARRAVCLHEGLEDQRQRFRLDADAGVAHPQDRIAAFARDAEVDASGGRGVLHGVVEEIQHDLLQAGGIDVHPCRFARQ
jgi:hypothetical protein